MKLKNLLLLCCLSLASCQSLSNKDEAAIQLVQESKFGVMNVYNSGLIFLVGSRDPTNLELANIIAENQTSDHFVWDAKKISGEIYLVEFKNEKSYKALVWEADLENNIVRCASCDAELSRKYKLSTDTLTSIKPRHRKRKQY